MSKKILAGLSIQLSTCPGEHLKFLKKIQNSLEFEQKNFRICKKCILRDQRNTSVEEKFQKKFSDFERKSLDFEQKNFGRVAKIAFCVWEETFRAKRFQIIPQLTQLEKANQERKNLYHEGNSFLP